MAGNLTIGALLTLGTDRLRGPRTPVADEAPLAAGPIGEPVGRALVQQRAVPEGLAEAGKPKPIGLFSVLRKFLSHDTRRVLIATASILESLGKSLGSKKSP